MAKPAPNYALVFLMFAFSAVATCWLTSRPNAALFSPRLNSFPRHVSQWYDEDIPIDSEIQSVLNADAIIYRCYRNSTREDPLSLLVVYRKYGRREFAHRPEACYPAAGWEIVDKGYINVPYGGRYIRAVKVVAARDDEKEVIVYWFASGRETEANYMKQQLDMALDRLRKRKYGWAFIRINSPVSISEDDTLGEIRQFLRSASLPLADTLTGSRTPATARQARNGRSNSR